MIAGLKRLSSHGPTYGRSAAAAKSWAADSTTANDGREIARAMDEVDHFDLVFTKPIDKPVALNEKLTDVRIVFFGNDAAALSEPANGTGCIASLAHESCWVAR